MTETLDPLEKARLRLLKRTKQREQDEQREKDQAARIRKMESDYDHRRAVVMGRLVRDKWDGLLDSTRAEISGLLAASELTDSDKVKLARFLPAPTAIPDEMELVDYVPSRKDKKADDLKDDMEAAE